jgi:hypothetical protein
MSASIPLWAPAVLLLLVGVGYRQSRARTVRPATMIAVATGMLVFSLYGVAAAFHGAAAALVSWVAGYALAITTGNRLVSLDDMGVAGNAVRIPGSWVPLALMLGIFAIKFVLGFAEAVHSPLLHSVLFIAAMSGSLGAISGMFGARAVAVHRVARAPVQPA